jgi:large subunit ribosomal protein L15
MKLHQVTQKTKRAVAKRVGRGGKRGKTAGRGTKGQKARAGHHIRPEIRDVIQRLPKRRGYGKNRARTINDSVVKPMGINLALIEELFSAGETVSPETLVEKGVISLSKSKSQRIKILGAGELSKKLSVSNCLLSETAKSAIEKVGGSIA